MSRETVDNAIGGYEESDATVSVGGVDLAKPGSDMTVRMTLFPTADLDELQRKADMADELAEALMPIAARGEISASIIHVAKAALAKYRGQS